MDPSDHLFRHESGRMVAALTRIFGVHNYALAEDVVQDAFVRAMEVWKFAGMPDNPSAWLMTTAKNRARDVLRRERTARTFAPELGKLLESEWTLSTALEENFSPHLVQDDLLRMMFSCCDPELPEIAQIALILNILCGFSAGEIASALLTGLAAIEKRISRGKKVLAQSDRLFQLTDAREVANRLSTVHQALYLLFNEGYHGSSPSAAIRSELCFEAMRLTDLLRESHLTATPTTLALAALMALHASRLPARLDAAGNLSSFVEQDRSRWDHELAGKGIQLLERAAEGSEVTVYHLEAAIAAVHSRARSVEETDWAAIVFLYDRLLEINPSPVVALSRAIAVAEAEGAAHGLEAIRAIDERERLERYPFFHAALGELELRLDHGRAAEAHFLDALRVARNPTEREFLSRRIAAAGAALPT
ncbi:MAG TPA: DUF6596 domain-containing protein [Fimbriimonadaceae bacterium]|nr:DUF6596 domain-containing protein [Fimbriimonadaceae bacterium]